MSEAEFPLFHPLHGRIVLPLLKVVFSPVFMLLGPMLWRNRRAIPRKGGLIILANHMSDVDPVMVQWACPRPIYFMAKSELFLMPTVGKLIRWFRAFPVRRGAPDRKALRFAEAVASRGDVVCVFPEGQISESGELLPLMPGVSLIVRKAGCAVICCGLVGTNRIRPLGAPGIRPALSPVYAIWGQPRVFGKDDEPETIMAWAEAELRSLTNQ